MDPRIKALIDLPSKSLDEMLEMLAALSEKRRDNPAAPVPRVSVHLTSGRTLQGNVIKAGETRRSGRYVVFHDPGHDARNPAFDVVYLPVSVIEAITFHDQLTFARPAAGNAPPRLELKRKLATIEEAITAAAGKPLLIEVDWPTLAENEDDRLAVAKMAEAFHAALTGVLADDMGKQAVAAKLSKVSLTVGPNTSATLENGVFKVVSRSSYDVEDVAAIKTALERGL